MKHDDRFESKRVFLTDKKIFHNQVIERLPFSNEIYERRADGSLRRITDDVQVIDAKE